MTSRELMQYLMCAGATTTPHLCAYYGQSNPVVYKAIKSCVHKEIVQKIGRVFCEGVNKPIDVYSFTPEGASLCRMNWKKLTNAGVLKALQRSEIMSMNPEKSFVYDRMTRWEIMQKHDLVEVQFQRHDPLVMLDEQSGNEHAYFTLNSIPPVVKRLHKFTGKMKFHMVTFPNYTEKIQDVIDKIQGPKTRVEWAELYKSLDDEAQYLKTKILNLVKSIPADDETEHELKDCFNGVDIVSLKTRPFFEGIIKN